MQENSFAECAVSLKYFLMRADDYQICLSPIKLRAEVAVTVELQEVQSSISTPACCPGLLLDCSGWGCDQARPKVPQTWRSHPPGCPPYLYRDKRWRQSCLSRVHPLLPLHAEGPLAQCVTSFSQHIFTLCPHIRGRCLLNALWDCSRAGGA